MDILYLITVAFFTILVTKAWETITVPLLVVAGPTIAVPFSWPLLIAAAPLAGLLYFGWRSSKAFLAVQLVTMAVTIVGVQAGLLPI